jgi:hypothetical protein
VRRQREAEGTQNGEGGLHVERRLAVCPPGGALMSPPEEDFSKKDRIGFDGVEAS